MTPAIRPHLSASQLTTYLMCGVSWERQYVRGERRPANGPMIRGSALDEAANLHYRDRAKGGQGLDAEEFVEAAISNHQARLVAEEVVLDVPEADAKAMLARAAAGYWRDIARKLTPRSVADVQRRFTVQIDDFEIVGIVDLVTDSGAVVDCKYKSRLPSASDVDSDLQLSTYALLTGATNLALAVAKPDGKTAILWTTRTPQDVERTKLLYSRVHVAIQLGVVIPAAPGSWTCSPTWCPFWKSCPFGGG
jgi:hypothetical protein